MSIWPPNNCLLDTISFFVLGQMDNNLLKFHS